MRSGPRVRRPSRALVGRATLVRLRVAEVPAVAAVGLALGAALRAGVAARGRVRAGAHRALRRLLASARARPHAAAASAAASPASPSTPVVAVGPRIGGVLPAVVAEHEDLGPPVRAGRAERRGGEG